MSINAQQKGKRAEREIKNILQSSIDKVYESYPTAIKPTMERNQMQSAVGGYDIVGVDWLAPEIKHCEQLAINTWWAQTVRQAKPNQMPVLIYKVSRKGWHVVTNVCLPVGNDFHIVRSTMSLDDFLAYFEARLLHDIRSSLAVPQA